MQRLRGEDLFKAPGIAETVDWAKCLFALDVLTLSPEVIADTLGAVLKYQDDIQRLEGFAPKARGIATMLAHVDDFRAGHSVAPLEALTEALDRPAAAPRGIGRELPLCAGGGNPVGLGASLHGRFTLRGHVSWACFGRAPRFSPV